MASQRLALVTGSTSGIGLAIAKVLSSRGGMMVLNGLDGKEQVASAVEQCKTEGAADVVHHGADLAQPEQIDNLFSFIKSEYGKTPDILVNNAGVQHVESIESFPKEKWDLLLAVCLSASFHTMKHSLSGMKERGWGRVVNISSVHGLVASVNKSAYVAAKHGIIGLTKVGALEAAGTGVTCNAVCPGFVLTPLIQAQIQAIADKQNISFEEAKEILVGEKHPSKQTVLPEEVASLVDYLCGEKAQQVTGSSFSIDGGWACQ